MPGASQLCKAHNLHPADTVTVTFAMLLVFCCCSGCTPSVRTVLGAAAITQRLLGWHFLHMVRSASVHLFVVIQRQSSAKPHGCAARQCWTVSTCNTCNGHASGRMLSSQDLYASTRQRLMSLFGMLCFFSTRKLLWCWACGNSLPERGQLGPDHACHHHWHMVHGPWWSTVIHTVHTPTRHPACVK